MKTFAYSEVQKNISKILEMVKNGEEIVVGSEKGRGDFAIIIPYKKYKAKKERALGILKGKASYKLTGDFKITDEEMLSL